ncbi:MAG: 50S ribosomal protein L11 methyltransferase [Bryobacteraceae bacterium]|nr:50S ribosomal protein L11 methyltransferase [Bryobacteraceae bacterium]
MVSVFLHCAIEAKDELIAELSESGTTGIVEEDGPGGRCRLEAYFETGEEALAVSGRFPEFTPEVKLHQERDYVREFQQQWTPLAIGRRFWLTPPWDAEPAPDERIRIEYRAGMACGSGAHPCTQLCLEALEEFVEPGGSLLDVGVGSGILSHAAKLLGAGLVVGCDMEHNDAVIAHELVNNVFTGSLRSVRDESFDVVVANINAAVVGQLWTEFERVAKPRGRLIFSGFQTDQLRAEWAPDWVRAKNGWCCASRPARESVDRTRLTIP